MADIWTKFDTPENAARIFFPRRAAKRTVPGAVDFDIPVAEDAAVGARWFGADRDHAPILYFHGNGEIVPDYDDLAGDFRSAGLSLFVVDYRGYGWSSGWPTIQSLTTDPPGVADFFFEQLKITRTETKPFLMGRSLGSGPACDLALRHPDKFAGLILESAFADILPLLDMLGIDPQGEADSVSAALSNDGKLSKIAIPVLIIHGDQDFLIPLSHARQNFHAIAHDQKEIQVLRGAGHNDLLAFRKLYFGVVRDFVKKYGG